MIIRFDTTPFDALLDEWADGGEDCTMDDNDDAGFIDANSSTIGALLDVLALARLSARDAIENAPKIADECLAATGTDRRAAWKLYRERTGATLDQAFVAIKEANDRYNDALTGEVDATLSNLLGNVEEGA